MKKFGISDWIIWAIMAYLIIGVLGVNVPGAESMRCEGLSEAQKSASCITV